MTSGQRSKKTGPTRKQLQRLDAAYNGLLAAERAQHWMPHPIDVDYPYLPPPEPSQYWKGRRA